MPLTPAFGKGCGPAHLSSCKDKQQTCADYASREKRHPLQTWAEARRNGHTLRKFPGVPQNSHHELVTTTPEISTEDSRHMVCIGEQVLVSEE